MDGGLRCRWPVVSFAGWARRRWRLVVLVTSAAETEIEARREETDGKDSVYGLAHAHGDDNNSSNHTRVAEQGRRENFKDGQQEGTVFFNIDDHGQMMGWE